MERKTTLWERAAALMLALFMVFSMMPLQAFAEGETPTVTISGPQEISVDMDSIELTANVQNPPQGAEISYEWSVNNLEIAQITVASSTSNATLKRQGGANGPVVVTCKAKKGDRVVAEGMTTVLVKRNAKLNSVSITPASAKVGDTLTATPIGDDSGSATYVWTKDDRPIPGATESTYCPKEVGSYKVKATVKDDDNGIVEKTVESAAVNVEKFLPILEGFESVQATYSEAKTVKVSVNAEGEITCTSGESVSSSASNGGTTATITLDTNSLGENKTVTVNFTPNDTFNCETLTGKEAGTYTVGMAAATCTATMPEGSIVYQDEKYVTIKANTPGIVTIKEGFHKTTEGETPIQVELTEGKLTDTVRLDTSSAGDKSFKYSFDAADEGYLGVAEQICPYTVERKSVISTVVAAGDTVYGDNLGLSNAFSVTKPQSGKYAQFSFDVPGKLEIGTETKELEANAAVWYPLDTTSAGPQALTYSFTPTDSANYASISDRMDYSVAQKSLDFTVSVPDKKFDNTTAVKGTPTITLSDSTPLVSGNEGASLNLTASDLVFSSAGFVTDNTEVNVGLANDTSQPSITLAGGTATNYKVGTITYKTATILKNEFNDAHSMPSVSFVKDGKTWYQGASSDNTITVTAAEGYTLATELASENNNFTNNIQVGVNEDNKLVFYARNGDGDIAKIVVSNVAADNTAPDVGLISAAVTANGSQNGNLDMDNTQITYTFTVQDSGSGAKEDEVFYYVGQTNTKPDVTANGWISADVTNLTFQVIATQTGYIWVKAGDNVGNMAVSNSYRALVIETDAPTVTEVKVDGGNDGLAGAACQSHTIQITAQDAAAKATENTLPTYSGIKDIQWTLTKKKSDGTLEETPTLTGNDPLDAPADFDGVSNLWSRTTVVITLSTDKDRKKLDGDYLLSVTAIDFCGNRSVAETKELHFDNTAPVVTAAMTTPAVPKGDIYYYRADNGGLKVTFEDDHLGDNVNGKKGTYSVNVTSDGSNSPVLNKSLDTQSGATIGTVTFKADEIKSLPDGTVTVTVNAEDAAGNVTRSLDVNDANYASDMTFSFVLDKTAPRLTSVSSTEGNYYETENKVYYNNDFTVTFVVEETNYDANCVQLANGNTEVQTGIPEMLLSKNQQNAITVSVARADQVANALYQPQLTVTDKAGNAMVAQTDLAESGQNGVSVSEGKATTTATFVLDTTAPILVSVEGTDATGHAYREGVYYQGGFDATFTIDEINYDASQTGSMGKSELSIKKNDVSIDDVTNMVTRTSGNAGNATHTVKASVQREDTPKTVYSIALTVTDKAGNPLTATENAPYKPEDDSSQIYTTVDENGTATLKNRIMDNVAPEVEIEYTALEATHYYKENGDDAAATAYYNTDLMTTFTFNDVGSLDENKLCFARTYEGARDDFAPFGTGVEISEERIFDGSKNAKFKIGIDPKDNGIYTYTIYGEDKAGNPLKVTEKEYYGKNTNRTVAGCDGSEEQKKYTTAPKAMDTVSPTATITYTPLKETHYYPEGETQVNAYYNKNFDAKFQFADTYGNGESTFGVDPAKLRYTQNITAEQDKVLPSDDTLEVSYSVTGTSEGDHYTFGAYGEDKAGNPLNVTENSTTSPTASNPYTAASQEAQQLNYHKVLDTVAPVATFQIVPTAKPAHPEMQTLGGKNRFYLNTQFTATYSIDEINYDNSKVKAWYGHSNPEDYLNSSVSADTSATANNGFSAPDKIRSFTSTLDGLYSFTLTGEDRAGNQITAGGQGTTLAGNPLESVENDYLTSYIITVDTVSPVLQAGIGDYYEAALRENAYSVSKNSPYRNERSATLTLTATDPSPKVIRYATTSTLGDSADGDLNALDSYNQGGSVLSLTKDFSGEQVFAITELAVADLAGNVSTAPANVDGNVSNYIYLDVTPPTEDKLAPTVSLVAHESGQGRSVQGVDLYNSTVTVEAKISDPGFGEGAHGTGGTSSGLFTLHYVVQHNDSENWNAQMEGKVATTSTNHGITTGADGIVYYTESKKGDEYTSIDPGVANEALVGEDTITFTFDAATFNYNDISIRVWAEDNTGHKSGEAIYRFGIDTTAPKIQVTYDNNDARNEKYFKADRTATVVVTERNFDPDNTVITTEVGHSGWSYAAGGLANGDDDTWTCTVPYTEDADYTFNVTAKDLVGHDAGEADYGDSVAPREFTVDKTKPVIEITFDNNDVRNGRYYKENRTATIHIEEHNFAAEDAEVTTTAEIAEGGVAAPAAGSWGSAGDSNTAQVPFNADGDYTMQVKFQDKAGNEAEPKEVELFTVDTTAPELTFSINDEAFEAGSYTPRAYNGQVVPGITYHDINYDGSGTQMSIVGAKNVNSQILSGAPAEDAMGGVYTCENIAETPENDDVYTCTGRVVDMAGNESTVDFLFSVNRYGSNYLLTPDTQALVDNYYTNSAPNLGVSEINVNTLKFEEITYALNGDIRTLQPGTDYQVTESGSETSWKQYDYTIFNSNFDREGVYDITIYSEDEAGNANSNHTERVKEYSKNISFVLDQTAPSITISGVDEGGIYDTDTRSVTVAYGENFAMDNLIITNGEKTETYTAEQLQATGGTLEFVVPASREKQSVKVTAADKAGNIATIESPRFVLSSSLFVRWVNNTPVMVGTISFGVLAVAAVADYLRKGFLFALLHKHTGVKH